MPYIIGKKTKFQEEKIHKFTFLENLSLRSANSEF